MENRIIRNRIKGELSVAYSNKKISSCDEMSKPFLGMQEGRGYVQTSTNSTPPK